MTLIGLKVKPWKKICITKNKIPKVAILLNNKISKIAMLILEKHTSEQEYYELRTTIILWTLSRRQYILNVYTPSNRTSKYLK